MSLFGMIVTAIVVVLVATTVLKVVPAVVEYFTIVKDANAVASNPDNANAGADAIRESFLKRAEVDDITAITPSDLEITKEGGNVVIAFAYTKKIPLGGPVSLVIDFEGRTKPGR